LSSLIGLAFAGTEQIAAHAEIGMNSNLGNTRTGALPLGLYRVTGYKSKY
jgi:hypothetical protein